MSAIAMTMRWRWPPENWCGYDRVERCHRLLKDHRERATAMAAHGLFGELQEVVGVAIGA
jgi:hypothetical protein